MNDDKLKALMNNPAAAGQLLRTSLKLYIKVFHYYLYRKEFIFQPFHEIVIKKLEDIAFGINTKNNLYIGIAPRFGKSAIAQYFTSWSYALNQDCNFLYTSYGDDLVNEFSSVIRSIINSPLYKQLFEVSISRDTNAKDLWKITGGGALRAAPLKGVITGFGAGIVQDTYGGAIIIDDFLKAADYRSQAEKERVIDIFENTLKSRRNNPKTPIIIIAQRLATDDLIGYLQNNPQADEWDFCIIPTADEDKQTSIWEDKLPYKDLMKMKRINPFLYYSQYQQNPIVIGGSVIKTEWFRYYSLNENYAYRRLFITADTAMKVKEHNDYSVFLVVGVTENGKLHILDMLRGKWEAPDLRKQLVYLWNKWSNIQGYGVDCSGVYIEDKASGTGLIQEFSTNTSVPVFAVQTDKDKLTRVEAMLPHLETGNILLPVNEVYGFNPDIISECQAFTRDDSHKHDDIIDALCIAVQEGLAQLEVSILDFFR